MRALIGYTGFIGSNLATQTKFDCYYNTSNIEEIRHKHFKKIFFAGLPGVKWKANANPEEDKSVIDEMISILSTVSVESFTYISTIDVYENHVNVDEDSLTCFGHYPYGANRAKFEDFVLSRFSECISVRLPIVFGRGFKKNYLFDLMNEKNLSDIFLDNKVQFYDVSQLTSDIVIHSSRSRKIVNLATEPVTLDEVVDMHFPSLKNRCVKGSNYSSNMISKYSSNGYFEDKAAVLKKIGDFIR